MTLHRPAPHRAQRHAQSLTHVKYELNNQLKSSNLANVGLLNTRSVKNKAPLIKDFIVHNNLDLVGINETWLGVNDVDNHIIKDLLPTGFKIYHTPRLGRGGGNALIYNGTFDLKSQCVSQFKSFEYMECLVKSNGKWIRIVIIYRPPPSPENKLTVSMFLSELSCLFERLTIATGELVVFGDFNFHVETDKPDVLKFLSLLDSFCLKQHVSQPTHVHGHILDLIITRNSENIVRNVVVHDPGLSDHKAISFKLMVDKPLFPIGKCLTHHRIEVTMEKPFGYLVQTKEILHQSSK